MGMAQLILGLRSSAVRVASWSLVAQSTIGTLITVFLHDGHFALSSFWIIFTMPRLAGASLAVMMSALTLSPSCATA